MNPIDEFRIHIGAHKTATTHLQHSLALQRDELIKSGLDFIPRKVSEPLRRSSWRTIVPMKVHERRWTNTLASFRRGPQVVAISDENIAGGSRDLLREIFYPRLEARLKALASLVGHARLRIFLSVRSLDTLLPSAYVETIRGRPFLGGFESVREKCLQQPPRWSELVDRIRSTVPDAQLKIWKYEDYRKHSLKIISVFSGVSAVRDIAVPSILMNTTPSASTVMKIETISPWQLHKNYRSKVRQLRESDRGTEKFSPFSEAERLLLAQAYEDDLSRIDSTHPDALITFA